MSVPFSVHMQKIERSLNTYTHPVRQRSWVFTNQGNPGMFLFNFFRYFSRLSKHFSDTTVKPLQLCKIILTVLMTYIYYILSAKAQDRLLGPPQVSTVEAAASPLKSCYSRWKMKKKGNCCILPGRRKKDGFWRAVKGRGKGFSAVSRSLGLTE